MKKIMKAQADLIETKLRLIGATQVEKVSTILYYVKFEMDNQLEVSYVYNINRKDKYFLQRVKPYPIPEGLFSDEDQVVEFIKRDIRKFKNAQKSSNFSTFIELVRTMNEVSKDMESLFLNYNVEKIDLDKLLDQFKSVKESIHEAKLHSTHVMIKEENEVVSVETD